MNQTPHEPDAQEQVHKRTLLVLRLRNAAKEASQQQRPLLAALLAEAANVVSETIPQPASPTSPE
ncbi:hypothetical protein BLA39750_02208 [Burkholderia lata]|uniref:Uncharacterized protein n=1 Tax=Burkholderia lata (strain ATCC 17760 / DSM 23089 / LMG 22485 / NCIMB 9086 / R18194 / 383) TaxID=482957 RepID=A0A6P2WMR8_BURL3|nr:hypothetical protein [Burkholderia lata]VWC95724.1 hypothetical protein BLA39750_02208 [Burkholderia lata]